MVSVLGFSFSGSGQNAALAFVPLKPWDERKGAEHSAQALAGRAFGALAGVRDAFIFALVPAGDPRARHRDRLHLPPAGPRRQRPRRAARGAQPAARHGGAEQGPGRACAPTAWRTRRSCRSTSTATAPARSASRFDSINAVLSTALGSTYVNDFPNAGRLQRVVVQADAPHRMQPDDLMRSTCATARASSCRCRRWRRRAGSPARSRRSATTATRRCASPAMPRPATRTGDAMNEMERAGRPAAGRLRLRVDRPVARGAPVGRDGDDPARGFSLLAVFLCLAALYESWSIPFAVLLAVPLGVLGAVLGATLRGMPNDVFFKVGLITVIGLSAKNAILIIEFAKDLHAAGQGPDRGDARGGAPALPADPDDLDRLHPRRAAAGGRRRAPARPASARSAPA